MPRMDWTTAIENWRKLTPRERRQRQLASLPHKVARSMAFEGEPVDEHMLEAELERLIQPTETPDRHSIP